MYSLRRCPGPATGWHRPCLPYLAVVCAELLTRPAFARHQAAVAAEPEVQSQLGGLLPETLELRYWNGSEWANNGILFINHDVANHRYTLAIMHLSQFALFAAAPTDLDPGEEPAVTPRLFLPAVSR